MNINVLRTVLLLIASLSLDYGVGQDYLQYMVDPEDLKTVKYNLKQYKKYQSIGDSLNNCRNGLWKDISVDTNIYSQGEYLNCKPIGNWYWYYPNGDIRLIKEYDSLGNITVWCRYFDNVKMAELHCLTKLTKTMRKYLYNFEKEILSSEFQQHTSNLIKLEDNDKSTAYVYSRTNFDFYKAIRALLPLIERFEGRFGIKLWDYSGKLVDEYYYCNSSQISRISYEYKLKRINKKKIYKDGELRIVECYDKNGALTKKKIIK